MVTEACLNIDWHEQKLIYSSRVLTLKISIHSFLKQLVFGRVLFVGKLHVMKSKIQVFVIKHIFLSVVLQLAHFQIQMLIYHNDMQM